MHAGFSFSYLLVAEAASFDKKELCRSDTILNFFDADPGWKKIRIRDKHPISATLLVV
jgi:hypothetical protein